MKMRQSARYDGLWKAIFSVQPPWLVQRSNFDSSLVTLLVALFVFMSVIALLNIYNDAETTLIETCAADIDGTRTYD